MRRRLLELLLGGVLAVLVMACEREPPSPPVGPIPNFPPRTTEPYPLLEPSGPHPVGKLITSVVDLQRGGIFAEDPPDRRELSLYVWYPTEPERLSGPARYASPVMAQAAGMPVELASLVRTNATAAPPLSSAEDSWPVVLFLPGFGANVEFYSSLLEELASHGYVVVGIDPTFIALVSEFPDGRIIHQDADLRVGEGFVPTPLERGRQRAIETLFQALLTTYSQVMVDDASFVLDALAEWNREGGPGRTFAQRLDLSRAGIFGHSMGGMATIRALVREPRFRAGINMDGGLFGDPGLPLRKPLMILGVSDLFEQSPVLAYTYERVEGPAWWISLEGAGHFSFSDAGLLLSHFYGEDAARRGPFLGPIDPVRATNISREYLVAFFEQHLRGNPQLLLEGTPADYPEVRVHQHCGRSTPCVNP